MAFVHRTGAMDIREPRSMWHRTINVMSVLVTGTCLSACASGTRSPRLEPVALSAATFDSSPLTIANGQSIRVGGDVSATISSETSPSKDAAGGTTLYRSGRHRIDTPLPDGYPAPTPPGAIDLKRYPSVRRAEVVRSDNPDGALFGLIGGKNSAFWPLFRHIQSRDIPMTSPVEVNLSAAVDSSGRSDSAWQMSFLYRNPALGPTGAAERGVIVRDAEAVTVVSLGVSGQLDISDMQPALGTLRGWIASNGVWIESGPPRVLYYNDPMTNPKWSEVQLPVSPRPTDAP